MRSRCGRILLLGLVLVACICATDGWTKSWKSSKQMADVGGDPSPNGGLVQSAVFELESKGSVAEEDGIRKTSLMKQAHAKSLMSPESTCWQKAYRKLLTSCSQILQDEEKKCRLAFEFTDCFLRMTGWPPPPLCPDSSLVRFCTEKFDEHTHEVYLAFFVETAAMCHHLQSEAFRKEARDVVNDLKQTGHQVLDKVKEVKGLSQDIIVNALQQSERLKEKLTGVETLSQSLLDNGQHFETQLKSTLGSVQAVYDISDNIKTQQKEIQQLHHDMHQSITTNMQELQKAALNTNQQLLDTSEGYKQLANQQVQLADSLVENVQHLKDSALQSLNELKDSQTFAMEETRDLSSLNHELLLRLHRKLSDLASKSHKVPYYLEDGHNVAEPPEDNSGGPFSLRFTATARSLSQAMASKILCRVHKFVRRRRWRRKNSKNDAFKCWMEAHGLDTSTLQLTDDSSYDDDDDHDPDYECSEPYMDKVAYSNYNLRSLCSQSGTCRFHARRFK